MIHGRFMEETTCSCESVKCEAGVRWKLVHLATNEIDDIGYEPENTWLRLLNFHTTHFSRSRADYYLRSLLLPKPEVEVWITGRQEARRKW
jgi:hypothetical protein